MTLEEALGKADFTTVALPVRHIPEHGTPAQILRYRFIFQHEASDGLPQAISIGEALPFYRLSVNGANLTPDVDIAATNIRDLAPHLHVLPADVLRQGRNVVELELPFAVNLGDVRVDQVCVGGLLLLEPPFRANWWRMIGIPTMVAMLFFVLILLAAALWLVSAQQPAYGWYIACLLLLLVRIVYVSTSARPGTPLLWFLLQDIAHLLQPYALYQLMSAYWQFSRPWLAKLLLAMVSGALICTISYFVPQSDLQQIASALFLLIILGSDLLVIGAMASQLHTLHWLEKGVVVWVGVVGFLCCMLEVANLFLPLTQRWMWTYPPAGAFLAIGFGYFLIRRMVLGADFFTYATHTLADDLDNALASEEAPRNFVWADVSATIMKRERGRMMRDIHDGFGSRLVIVLTQSRHELPQSTLHQQIQRALLDMRLMIDVMDEASRSLVTAMATLRHRIEPTLAAANIASEWRTEAIEGVSIDDRRKLMTVFRCLEELISNSRQHSGTERVIVDVTIAGPWMNFSVEDDGCGVRDADRVAGRGLERSRLQAEAIGGSLLIGAGRAGRGTRCVLRTPLF